MSKHRSLLAIAVAAPLSFLHAADTLPEPPATGPHIVVIGNPGPATGEHQVDPSERLAAPAADGADLLRQVPGVSAGRMGGRGLEPVVRGQSQNRVNVLVDGAFIFGACPNRMDPPTAFAAVDTWDRVKVVKGVQSLLHGPGGSGGTVLFERDASPDEEGWSGRAGAGGTDNGTDWDLLADLGWRSGSRFVRGRAQSTRADNYEDGSGRDVRSAYDEDAASLAVGTGLGRSSIEVSWDGTRARDVLYAGAGMDAPEEDSSTWRAGFATPLGNGGTSVSVDAWRADVDHLMDNYSNRPLTAPMAMRVPSTSVTNGARAIIEMADLGAWDLTLGFDLLDSDRDATRYQGPTPGNVTVSQSFMWPGVTVRQAGVTLEASRDIGRSTVVAGIRYDHVDTEADRADTVPDAPMAVSPNTLYRNYYGRAAGEENEDNFSALLTWQRPVSDSTTVFAGASRTVRTADATERYLAANNPMDPTQRWVGNPGIAPEAHHQIDLGATWRTEQWELSAAAFIDRVEDFITSDRARGQDGILLADGARVYRNVDAELYGLEGEARLRWGSGWQASASAAWVRGENTSDGRSLYQIPPLNGQLELARDAGGWQAGGRVRWASGQSRADDDPATGSGLDPGETPGWGVFDLFASIDTGRLGELRAGIDNLFDRTYADHLNRANQDPFNLDPVQVNEPGRVAWLGWRSGW